MAITFQTFTQTTPVDAATHVVTKPTGTVDGDLIVLTGSVDAGQSGATLTAPDGTWNLILDGGLGDPTPTQAGFVRVWTKFASSEPASWTFGSNAGANSQFTASRFNGATGATVVSANVSGKNTFSTTHTAPSGNALSAGDVMISGAQIIAQSASSTYGIPASMTVHGTLTNTGTWLRHWIGSEVLASPGATGTRAFTSTLTPNTWGDTTWTVILSLTTAPASGFSPEQVTARGIPLTVRLKTRRKDMDVTAQISELSFRSSIPGGFATCQIALNRPLDIQPDEIEYFATVYVYDGRSAATVWEGRLEDPGRGAGDSGEVWAITAIGPKVHATDQTFPIIYVDKSLERWKRSRYSVHGAHTERGELDDDETETLMVYADENAPVLISWAGDWIYRDVWFANQLLGRVRFEHVELKASTLYQVKAHFRVGTGGAVFSFANNWSVTPTITGINLGTSGYVNTANVASIRVQRDTSTDASADANTLAQIYNITVRAVIKNLDGTDNLSTTGYNVNNIDPIEVVTDLLGRVLPKFDGPNAILAGSGVDIEQMAYPDGTTAEAILNDLALYDPQYYWAAWEANPANGRNRFEYRPWPMTVRYEAGVEDGFDSPGSGSELYNSVLVRYLNPHNSVRTVRVNQTVPELTDAGITRTGYIDISDEMGSTVNAQYIGGNFLIEHRYPPNAGTLRIGRPIIDHDTGRMIHPWEIRPGHLIRVRGVMPRVDALNPTNRDGVTIFRIVSTEFSISDGIAVLELDSFTRSLTRVVADIKKTIGNVAGNQSVAGATAIRKR